MQKFSIKNIVLVSNILFASAFCSMDSGGHTKTQPMSLAVAEQLTNGNARGIRMQTRDCHEETTRSSFAAPKVDKWIIEISKNQSTFIAGTVEVIMKNHGENIIIKGEDCIHSSTKKRIVQGVEIMRFVEALNCKPADLSVVAILEKCGCKDYDGDV